MQDSMPEVEDAGRTPPDEVLQLRARIASLETVVEAAKMLARLCTHDERFSQGAAAKRLEAALAALEGKP